MSPSATLTMLVSMISRSAPSATAAAMAHLLVPVLGRASAAGDCRMASDMAGSLSSASRVHRHVDAHPGAKRDAVRLLDDANAHGNPLHDLGEVARRVVRRKEREPRAGRPREAL